MATKIHAAPAASTGDLAPPRSWRRRDPLLQYGIALACLLLVAAPILPIIYQSFIDRPIYEDGQALTLVNYANLVGAPEFREVLGNTLLFAFLSTVIAQVVGLVTAILVGRTDVPWRHFFGDALLWTLFVSHLVLALGWVIMYGPSGYITGYVMQLTGGQPWNLYTIPGLSLAAGLSLAPLTYLYCIASATQQDPALEEAARVAGAGPFRILFSVTIPLLRPALVYSTILNFVIALEMLAMPLFLGGPVGLRFFTTFLYERGFEAPVKDYGLVGAAAVVLLIVITLLVLLQNRLLRNAQRFVTVGGKASRPRLLRLGRLRWAAFAFLLLYFVFGTGAVILGLVLRAFTSFLSPLVPLVDTLTWDNWTFIFSYPVYVRSIVNTLEIALVGGALGTVFIALVALLVHRSQWRWRRQLEFVALYPRAIPGILVGLGAFYAVTLMPFLGGLRNTIWILVLIYIMRYLPTGFGAVAPTLMQIGHDLDRAARTAGADWWTTCRRILAGLIRPALLSCFAILFIHFIKEYSAAVFLYAPGSEVMGTVMLSFWAQGEAGPVAALAVLQILVVAVFVVVTRKLFKVKIYG
ncbi:iron ABC transporter permease [Geminicoccaceae bacterium 1502E]|nr:iron ABC transporter permease [Geminicoccaceae bacterium 1502E]